MVDGPERRGDEGLPVMTPGEDAGPAGALTRTTALSPEDEAEVFERFRRGSAGRAGPSGTGLGLPIARELARRWGGEATIVGLPGRGARARLALAALSSPFPAGT